MAGIDLKQLDDRDVAAMVSLARCFLGAAMVITPQRAARVWTGEDPGPGLKFAIRGLGARDFALGLGTLNALENDGDVVAWLQAQMAADASDAFGILVAFRRMPRFRRWVFLLTAGGATALSLRLIDGFASAEPGDGA